MSGSNYAFDITKCGVSAIARIGPISPLCCELSSVPTFKSYPELRETVIPPYTSPPPDVYEWYEIYGPVITNLYGGGGITCGDIIISGNNVTTAVTYSSSCHTVSSTSSCKCYWNINTIGCTDLVQFGGKVLFDSTTGNLTQEIYPFNITDGVITHCSSSSYLITTLCPCSSSSSSAPVCFPGSAGQVILSDGSCGPTVGTYPLTVDLTSGAVYSSNGGFSPSNYLDDGNGNASFVQIYYYGSSSPLLDVSGQLYYRNAQFLTDSYSNLYHPNGNYLADGTYMYYPNGYWLVDSSNNLYYPNGNILSDSSNLLHTPAGYILADGSGNIYGSGQNISSLNASNLNSGLASLSVGGTGANLSATGGTGKYLKQTTLGGAVTVGTISGSDVPTLNQNTTGSAASLSISGQTGLLTFTGLTSTNRTKTVSNTSDTILELGGSYTPSGSWTNMTLVTPTLGTPASGNLVNCTGYVGTSALTTVGTLTSGSTGAGFTIALSTSTVTGTLGTTNIANNSVTYAKMQQASTITLLGNPTGGTANLQEITLGSGLAFSGSTLTASGSGGTVTSVAGTNSNGFTWSIANSTTTPNLSLAFIGNSSITTVGTITNGTWNASKIGLAYGGTNADLSATGGTGQYLKQSGSGSTVTVGTISTMDIPTNAILTTPAITFSNNASVAAAGASQGTATTLILDFNTVSSGSGGVALPAATAGRRVIIYNNTISAINVYPASGAAIDSQGTNAALSLPSVRVMEYNAASSTQWRSNTSLAVFGSALTGTSLSSTITSSSLTSFGSSIALGTPASGNLTNCTFPTLNQNTSGSAASLSISGQTGLLTFTGLASTNRTKTVRDAADTILELGGNYTPTGTWTNLMLVTPTLGTPFSGNLSNCTSINASNISSGTLSNSRLSGVALLASANTFTTNGAASTPPIALNGTWYASGTATTTKPQLLIEPTGTTSTGWSTAGTGFGVNAASGFTGNLLDLQVGGSSKLSVTSAGSINMPSAGFFIGTGGTATGTGSIAIGTNATATPAQSLAFGYGATTSNTNAPAVAIGYNSNAGNSLGYAVAIGNSSYAYFRSVCIGMGASDWGGGGGSVFIGCDTYSSATNSVAIGYGITSLGSASVAIGPSVTCAGGASVAIGQNAACANGYSVAIGYGASGSGIYSTAIGYNASASSGGVALAGAGGNLATWDTSGNQTNNGTYAAPLTTPSSSSAAGVKGTIAWDASYIYICTATNTWKRVALSTF